MKIFVIITVLLLFYSQISANKIPNSHRTKLFTHCGFPVAQNVKETQLLLVMGFTIPLSKAPMAYFKNGNGSLMS